MSKKFNVVIPMIAIVIAVMFVIMMFAPTIGQAKFLKKNEREVSLLDPTETYLVIDKQEGSTYIRSVGNSLFVALTLEDENKNRLHVKVEKMKSGTYEAPGLMEVIKEGALSEKTRTFDSMALTGVGDRIHYNDEQMIIMIDR